MSLMDRLALGGSEKKPRAWGGSEKQLTGDEKDKVSERGSLSWPLHQVNPPGAMEPINSRKELE